MVKGDTGRRKGEKEVTTIVCVATGHPSPSPLVAAPPSPFVDRLVLRAFTPDQVACAQAVTRSTPPYIGVWSITWVALGTLSTQQRAHAQPQE